MDIEDSYVVRVSRHDPSPLQPGTDHDHPCLAGDVENSSTGHRQAFHNIEELWAVLAKTGSPVLASQPKRTATEK